MRTDMRFISPLKALRLGASLAGEAGQSSRVLERLRALGEYPKERPNCGW